MLPVQRKVDLGIAKNYRGITVTSIAANVYSALLLKRIKSEIDKILRKNQNNFQKNLSTILLIQIIHRIIEVVRAKNLESNSC